MRTASRPLAVLPVSLLALLTLTVSPLTSTAQEDAADDIAGKGVRAEQEADAAGAGIETTRLTPEELKKLSKQRRDRARLYPIRHRISRYLAAAAEEAEDGTPERAMELLDKLNPTRLNPLERAQVYRLKAYVAYGASQYEAAIESFDLVLAEQILPIEEDSRIRFNIVQLYAAQQNWPELIKAVNRWFVYVPDPDPLAYYLLAIAYFQMEDFDTAQVNAEKAVDLSDEPREGWLQLLSAIYVRGEDYDNAAPVLEELLTRFTKKQYWVQLALIYGAREQYGASLAIQQIAYLQGLLTTDQELRRLARAYLYHNLPYPAANVVGTGLAEGTIEADADAYEMLANSWIAAREFENSLEPLQKAAALSDSGNLYVRLAQVKMQSESWGESAELLEQAIAKGDLRRPGNADLLLGISYYNAERVSRARSSFARARKHESTQVQAQQWIEHIDKEAQEG